MGSTCYGPLAGRRRYHGVRCYYASRVCAGAAARAADASDDFDAVITVELSVGQPAAGRLADP